MEMRIETCEWAGTLYCPHIDEKLISAVFPILKPDEPGKPSIEIVPEDIEEAPEKANKMFCSTCSKYKKSEA